MNVVWPHFDCAVMKSWHLAAVFFYRDRDVVAGVLSFLAILFVRSMRLMSFSCYPSTMTAMTTTLDAAQHLVRALNLKWTIEMLNESYVQCSNKMKYIKCSAGTSSFFRWSTWFHTASTGIQIRLIEYRLEMAAQCLLSALFLMTSLEIYWQFNNTQSIISLRKDTFQFGIITKNVEKHFLTFLRIGGTKLAWP